MKICDSHWKQLRAAIDKRGLQPFVSTSGEAAFDKIKLDLTTDGNTFDPLLNATFAIWNNALGLGGIYLLGVDEDGEEYCPICESMRNDGPPEDFWIKNAVDEQLQKAKHLKLIEE